MNNRCTDIYNLHNDQRSWGLWLCSLILLQICDFILGTLKLDFVELLPFLNFIPNQQNALQGQGIIFAHFQLRQKVLKYVQYGSNI